MRIRDGEHPSADLWREYESATEFANMKPLPGANRGMAKYLRDDDGQRNRWAGGCSNIHQWKRFVDKGWPEGRRKVFERMPKIESPTAQNVRRRTVWSDQGDEVEMERVYMGRLDTAWREAKRTWCMGPQQVRIWVNVTRHAGVPADAFFWAGAATIIASDALEEAGHSVEIVTFAYGKPTGQQKHMVVTLCAKALDEPLNLDRIAAMLCNAATMRVGMHGAIAANLGDGAGSGGYCVRTDFPFVPEEDILIDAVTKAQADREAKAAIEKIDRLYTTHADEV